MPDIVEGAEDEAAAEEEQQQHRDDPLAERHLAAEQEEHGEDQRDKAAGDVRQTLHRGGQDAVGGVAEDVPEAAQRDQEGLHALLEFAEAEADHRVVEAGPAGRDRALGVIGRDLAVEEVEQAAQVAALDVLRDPGGRELVGHDEVHRLGLRELVVGVRGGTQAQEGRDRDHRGHAEGDQAEEGELEQADHKAAQIVPVHNVPADEDQQHKDAGEQADVVAAKDREEEAEGVQGVAAVAQQADRAEHHQRQQGNRVEPDRVPGIAHDEAAQGVERGEDGDGGLAALEDLPQKAGKEHAGAADADQDGEVVPDHREALGQQDGDQIQGAGQIVGKQGQITRAHAGRPGVEQGIARKNPPAQIQIEGVVLMPLVVGEDHLRAEGGDLVQDPDHAYDQNGQEEGGNVDVARLDLAGEEASARLDAAMQAAGCRMRHMFHLWDRQGRIRYVDGKTKNSRDRAGPGPLRR